MSSDVPRTACWGSVYRPRLLADLHRRHPGFVQHWDPTSFGQPWLRDFPSAPPERRNDLDLHASPLPAALRSPLALAFYWVRWLPPVGQDVPVFLPGFKGERLVEVRVVPAPAAAGIVWHAVLHYTSLSERQPSTASALVSPDEHLMQIAFELHTVHGSGRGEIDQQGSPDHVLSSATNAPRACAASAMAGTSCTSIVINPDSRTTPAECFPARDP